MAADQTRPQKPPDVSVVIPTFNRASLVLQAIESCVTERRHLAVQVIVVDDGSTDATASVLQPLADEIEVVRLSANLGPSSARNEGMARIRGRYVKFLDSDDVLEPSSLPDEVEFAEVQELDLLCSDWGTIEIDESGSIIAGTKKTFSAPEMDPLLDALIEGRAVPISAVLYRNSHIAHLRWNPLVRMPDDWYFFCQAALRTKRVATRNRLSFWWRQHSALRASSGDLLTYARGHHLVLDMIRENLADGGELTEPRRRRLAQYYYKQLYVLALYDKSALSVAAMKIRELDPAFQPRTYEPRRFMQALARLLGFERAVFLYTTMKRAWLLSASDVHND